MDAGSVPESDVGRFLPSDLLLSVFSFVSRLPERQKTLASCCLVCRQWYSVAVEYLYEAPQITPRNFMEFARTICPERQGRSRRSDLGLFVRRFSMARLVHESSNSLTARLLGSMKGNLEHFTAGTCSFSLSSFVPLSKTKTLRTLDLTSLAQPVDLVILKKSTRSLDQLTSLRLPKIVTVPLRISEANDVPWPPNLGRLRLQDMMVHTTTPGVQPMSLLSWPDAVTSMTICSGFRYGSWPLAHVIRNECLSRNLRRLRLSEESGYLAHLFVPSPVIPNLTFLSLSARALGLDIFDRLVKSDQQQVWNLEILEFGPMDDFPVNQFIQVLDRVLGNLRRLGFHGMNADHLPEELASQLDRVLESNAIKAGYDRHRLQTGDIPVGVYYYE